MKTASPRVIYRPAALASPGSFCELQNLSFHSSTPSTPSTKSESAFQQDSHTARWFIYLLKARSPGINDKEKRNERVKVSLSIVVHFEHAMGLPVILPPWFNLFHWDIYHVEKYFCFSNGIKQNLGSLKSTGFAAIVFIS